MVDDTQPPAGPGAAGGHTNVISDGTDPVPTALVALQMHNTDKDTQLQQAQEYFDFLTNTTSNLLELNSDNVVRAAMISIPNSYNVKILYSSGIGASGIGRTAAEDGKFLFLCGDGGHDVGPPSSISLPQTMCATQRIAVMTETQFTTKLTEKGRDFTWPLLTKDKVTTDQLIMQLAPIPPFVVYDGFTADINAALIYERLMRIDTHGLPIYQHAKHFLLACLSKNNLADNKPFISNEILLEQPTITAKRWANERFKFHFPLLVPNVPPPAVPPTNTSDLAAQIATIIAAQRTQARESSGEEKKDGDDGAISGMSKQELRVTLQMCGKSPDGVKEDLPPWFLEVAAKGTQDSFKNLIIRKNIENNYLFDDADVPLTAQLVRMVNKRSWCGKESNTRRPSILNATEGLSPFIVLDLDEDEVARLNYNADALHTASHTTVDDILKLRKKAQAKVPETAELFMLTLRTFANLLYALFSEDCPFLKCVLQIIKALKQFSRKARDAMSITTRASILWVVLLQGRQFATGQMEVLAEFSALHTNLTAKQANIYHAEVPAELLHSKQALSKKRPLETDTANTQEEIKKTKTNPNAWHPKLKSTLEKAMKVANYPKFMQVLTFCGVDANDMYKKFGGKCVPNVMFGRCYSKNSCTRSHALPSDKEVEEILDLLKKFHEHPEDLAKGS
jgi:hypothetical protein